MNKKRAIAIILTFTLPLLCSCRKIKYKSDISCKELTDIIETANEKEYQSYDGDYIEYILEDTSYCNDHSIIYSSEVNDIDELGILKANSENDAKTLYGMLIDYITDAKEGQRAFIASYAPNELPKLDSARVERFGCYIIYSIATPEDSEKAISAITTALAE